METKRTKAGRGAGFDHTESIRWRMNLNQLHTFPVTLGPAANYSNFCAVEVRQLDRLLV